MVSFLKNLTREKIVLLKRSAKLPFPLKEGIVRLVDKKGHTLALVLDRETIAEIEEGFSASDPKFLSSIVKSRASGRVAGSEIKKKLKMK